MKKAVKIILAFALIVVTLIMIYSVFEFMRDGYRFEKKYGVVPNGVTHEFGVRLLLLGIAFCVATNVLAVLYIKKYHDNSVRYSDEEFKEMVQKKKLEKINKKMQKLQAEIDEQKKGE